LFRAELSSHIGLPSGEHGKRKKKVNKNKKKTPGRCAAFA